MGPFFDNRADIIWEVPAQHPPECQFHKNETGCKAGDSLFPHYKVDEQPNKKSKQSCFQKRRESNDKNAVAIVKSVSQFGLCIKRFRCTRFSRWKVSGKPDAESLGTNSKGTIHKVHATSNEYPRKERTIVGKNKCQSSSSARSLRYEIWGQVPWRDWTTAATKQGLETKKKKT